MLPWQPSSWQWQNTGAGQQKLVAMVAMKHFKTTLVSNKVGSSRYHQEKYATKV
jgi:hypothetical protein